ncbi:MAG: hypothetical protein V3W18_08870 [candidate division Zixibacteria bacterium]
MLSIFNTQFNGKMEIIKSCNPSDPGKKRIIIKLTRAAEPLPVSKSDCKTEDFSLANGTDKLLDALFRGI